MANSAIAQVIPDRITPDTTLGTESSQVKPLNPQNDRIDGGAIRDINLFHSFREFNIGEAQGAYFTNPAGIDNIISRVTGKNPSQILGTLGVLGNANLFLINPNGIIFGANAKLDINSSFVASTASSIIFADGVKFDVNPSSPLLTIKVPIGLQFQDMPGAIHLQSAKLEILPGKILALVGGNVSLDGTTILAPGGHVELGGLQKVGTVMLNQDGNFKYPAGVQRGNVSLLNGSAVNVRENVGGSITINAQNLNITEGSRLLAGIAQSQSSIDSKAGDIEINATEKIILTDTGTFIANSVLDNAKGQGGNVNVTAGSLNVRDGAQIFTGVYGSGNVGNININVRDTVTFDGLGGNGENSGAYASLQNEAIGRGGNINITARSLAITNGAVLEASTYGSGNAGSININTSDTVLFDGVVPDFNQVVTSSFSSGAYSRVERQGKGNAGSINIMAGTLKVTNGAVLTSSTDGRGNAGNVTINTLDAIFDGEGRFNNRPGFGFKQSSGAFSSVKTYGEGQGGNVNISANYLSFSNGAAIVTSTRGRGNAGNILINANTANLSGYGFNGFSSGFYSNTEPTGIGRGGEIKVNANSLQVRDGAVINALTANANDGGNITINTRTFAAANGGQVVTSTRNRGNAGNIILNAADNIVLSGLDDIYNLRADKITQLGVDIVTNQGADSGLLASTGVNSTGNGGSIFIGSDRLNIKDNGGVTVSSQGSGVAGNIDISARTIRLQNEGAIAGETLEDNGGNIWLQVQDLLLMRQNSLISTTAGTGQAPGNGGNIKIDVRNGFIVAVPQENNDIIANAFEGKGGFIDIAAFGVFGFEKSVQLTSKSDITAFSQTNPQLNGVIEINTLDIDPTQGLVNLPSIPRNVEISEGCQVSSNGQNVRFVNRGRGGVSSRPEEPLNAEMFIAGWVDLDGDVEDKLNFNVRPTLVNRLIDALASASSTPNSISSNCQKK